jgi:hypothetical protein
MTANTPTLAADGDLKFDRVQPAAPSAAPSITCAKCNRTVTTYYYMVDDASMCSSCKRALEAQWAQRKTSIGRAAIYGFGAAIAGAAIYYGVIAITNLEIGIVALLIGYMVGYAVRTGAGRGGRRLQVLAAGLTYLSVGMAYSPLALKPLLNGRAPTLLTMQPSSSTRTATTTPPALQRVDSTGAIAPVPTAKPARKTTSSRPRRLTVRRVVLGLGALAVFVVVLPLIAVVGTLPSGIISALIIGIGMLRAWKMTADGGDATQGATVIAGPFKVGRPAAQGA